MTHHDDDGILIGMFLPVTLPVPVQLEVQNTGMMFRLPVQLQVEVVHRLGDGRTVTEPMTVTVSMTTGTTGMVMPVTRRMPDGRTPTAAMMPVTMTTRILQVDEYNNNMSESRCPDPGPVPRRSDSESLSL